MTMTMMTHDNDNDDNDTDNDNNDNDNIKEHDDTEQQIMVVKKTKNNIAVCCWFLVRFAVNWHCCLFVIHGLFQQPL